MSVLVCVEGRDNTKLMQNLRTSLPGVEIHEWPNCSNLDKVQFVIAWNAPESIWDRLPNLQVVQSYGAGVDGIALQRIPEHVEVTRIVDTDLADDMAEYILGHVMAHKLRIREYAHKQYQTVWKPKRAFKHNHIGILGLGELGQVAARKLKANDFSVSAWSRTKKNISGINCFAGIDELQTFLFELDYLVCLLPLTAETTGILNRKVFEQLPNHCILINVARGEHLIEEDLLWALDNQKLAGATLDVFNHEPLESGHAFWQHPLITLTPHCAAVTSMSSVCEQIVYNITACVNKNALMNTVDKHLGY
ncbi:glyoxylate/hydroxypyruvate reductase A [Pseudoalteromonas sp. MMG013]|uniref:2-hydroxyacid dehydrogenase n=1 Tax=Pseudoalteromonas sp. MMG013 TaxID=2822687 RepID=UPI001B395D17|nr:glyoxylate/hydroxypyruvate reductase A [Pseudoalteromonas sp. MMG013]MBQ4861746.1 glyoxylate/hydroxypyruvate reductase A [Pseudoalteromonas sp. MMG013]